MPGTGADLDRNAVLRLQLHELECERDDEAVDVGAGDVLQVAARADALLKTFADDVQVVIHRFAAGHFQLQEDVVVRAGNEDAGLLHADVAHEAEVLFLRADPARDLGVLIPPLHALIHGVAVTLFIQKEFALPDQPVRAAETVEFIENVKDLFGRVRRAGLLSVAERRVGDPDLLRHVVGNSSVVEGDLRDLGVREHIPEDVGLDYVIQNIHVLFDLEQVVFGIQGYRTILENIFIPGCHCHCVWFSLRHYIA